MWENAAEDNIFFLASGIAFDIMLAIVPFVLLVASGLAYFLNQTPDASSAEVRALIDRLLPPHPETADAPVHKIMNDVIQVRGAVGLYSALVFTWLSTRLFGALRIVLAEVLDIEHQRNIVVGKLFDLGITVVATLLLVAYVALSAYLSIATTRGVALFVDLGIRQDVMGTLEYSLGRVIAFAFIVALFFALYKYLPDRRVRWRTALLAATFAAALFEIAKQLYTVWIRSFSASSIYTGTLLAVVSVIFWMYYAAVIFVLGGEVAQVHHRRRVQRLQRETFEG